jgi:sodium/proline symporter
MAWVFISLAAAVVIGLVGHLFLQQHTDIKLDDPEKIFMVMINTIFANSILAKIFAGILLSSIMAAIMSTADSQLLVSASAFTNDLYKKVLHKNASNRELVLVSRIAVAAIALAAVIMASNEKSEFFKVVMKMVSFAWGGFGAAFGPLILLALFWKRTNLAGAVAGMVVGAATCFIWKFYLTPTFGNAYQIFNLYELAPGFILSLITIIVVSLCTKAPSKEIQDEFDSIGE